MKQLGSQTISRSLTAVLLLLFSIVAIGSQAESLVGTVQSVENTAKEITIDLGKDNGVAFGDKFRIFACNSFVVLPFSGGKRVLEIHESIAELTVKSVDLKTSKGTYALTKPEYSDLVKVGCIVEKVEIDKDINKKPEIKTLNAKGGKLFKGSASTLTLDCNDPDGDLPLFTWSAPGCFFHYEKTSFPNNIIYVPLSFAGQSVSVTVTADDRKGEGSKDTKSFTLQITDTPVADYYKTKYDVVRSFPQYLMGDKMNVDDVGVLTNGTIVMLDSKRQYALFYFDKRMKQMKKIDGFRTGRDLLTVGNSVFVLEDKKVTQFNAVGEKILDFFFDDNKLVSFIADARRLGIKRNGDIMIADGTSRQVKIFDKKGNYRISIGMAGQQPGGFIDPAALVEDRFGNIYVLDSSRKDIQVFNDKYELAGAPISLSSLAGPVDMLYDEVLHKLYILDVNGRILTIDAAKTDTREIFEPKSGRFLRFTRSISDTFYIASNEGAVLQRYIPGIGAAWYSDDNFFEVDAVSCDDAGNTYMLSKRFTSGMIRVVDRDGWYTFSMAPQDATEYGRLRDPNDIRVTPDGRKIFLLESSKRVVEFNAAGKYVANYEYEDSVSDIAVDVQGNLYALLGKKGEVYICADGNRKFLCGIQDKKIANRSEGLVVTLDGKTVYIANTKDNKLFLYSDGNFKEPYPAGKSDFRKFSRLVSSAMGVIFVFDANKSSVVTLFNSSNGVHSGPEIGAKDVKNISVNGNGDLLMIARNELRVLRMPFLHNE